MIKIKQKIAFDISSEDEERFDELWKVAQPDGDFTLFDGEFGSTRIVPKGIREMMVWVKHPNDLPRIVTAMVLLGAIEPKSIAHWEGAKRLFLSVNPEDKSTWEIYGNGSTNSSYSDDLKKVTLEELESMISPAYHWQQEHLQTVKTLLSVLSSEDKKTILELIK